MTLAQLQPQRHDSERDVQQKILRTLHGAVDGTLPLVVNSGYSGAEYNILGTPGAPAIVIAQGYVPSASVRGGAIQSLLTRRYPITLDAAGVARAMGRLTVLVTGIGGSSATRVTVNWREVR